MLDAGEADAISFGRPFLGNPDLPSKLARSLPLTDADPATFYSPLISGSQEPTGYTDYPSA